MAKNLIGFTEILPVVLVDDTLIMTHKANEKREWVAGLRRIAPRALEFEQFAHRPDSYPMLNMGLALQPQRIPWRNMGEYGHGF